MSENVYQKIAKVMSVMAKHGIAKDRKNQQQGYSFRGIDDVLNALSGTLASAGLVILPRVVTHEQTERQTAKGGAIFYSVMKVDFDFVSADDGSKHTVTMIGEAMDSADKSSNKAQSAAYKYACFQTFCIPTEGDNDADATTHEVKVATITSDQANELLDQAKATGTDVKKILEWAGVKEALDFPAAKFQQAMSRMKAKASANVTP